MHQARERTPVWQGNSPQPADGSSRSFIIPQTENIAVLTVGDFEPRLHDEFKLLTSNGEVPLQLAEVRRLGQALRAGGAFSLLFKSPPGPFLPQAIYPFSHPVRCPTPRTQII